VLYVWVLVVVAGSWCAALTVIAYGRWLSQIRYTKAPSTGDDAAQTTPPGGNAWSMLALCAVIAAAAGCGGTATVLAECPSPDGSKRAIFWVRMAGPAAGVVEYYLNVVPSGQPATATLGTDRSAGVVMQMAASDGKIEMRWHSSTRLEVDYPETATLDLAAPGNPYTPELQDLRVVDRGVAGLDVLTCDSRAAN
jgi:hypothetical protein